MPFKDPNKRKEYLKKYKVIHKDELKLKTQIYKRNNKSKIKAYNNIPSEQLRIKCRNKSYYYLYKYNNLIKGYEIHHCCTYDEPYKFIYCSKEMHRLIHAYLRQHNIDADLDHYKYIKHLLDDTVIKYNIE